MNRVIGLTGEQCRTSILHFLETIEGLDDPDRWVRGAVLFDFMATKLGMSQRQGANDLRLLVDMGVIERRPTQRPDALGRVAYAYRRAL